MAELTRQIVVPEHQSSLTGHAAPDSRPQDEPQCRLGALPGPAVGLGKRKALAVICHRDTAAEPGDQILAERPASRWKVGCQGLTRRVIDEPRQSDTQIDHPARTRVEPARLPHDAVQKLLVGRTCRFDPPPLERAKFLIEQATLDLAA